MNQPTFWSQANLFNLQDSTIHGTSSRSVWIRNISLAVTSQLGSLKAVDGAAVTHADSSLSICHYETYTDPLTLQPQAQH